MATVTAIRKADGGDQRAALRAAVENAETMKATLAKREAALEQAVKFVAAAQTRLETATAAVGEAKAAHAERVARALADGLEPPTATLQVARDTETETRDELDAARAAVEQIKAQIADLVIETADAENAVLVQINALFASVVARKLADAKRLRVELLVLKSELSGLLQDDSPPRFADDLARYIAQKKRNAASPLRDEVHHFLSIDQPLFDDEVWAKANAAQRAWKQARAALRSDPDVPLPP
jgi:hypothetical protein